MAIDPEPHMFCVISYFLSTKLFVSDLHPIAQSPEDVSRADIDVVIGLLEERTLPDDFRRALPGYIKHRFYHVQTVDQLMGLLPALFKVILNATERRHSVLVYSRRPEFCTAVGVSFFLRAHLVAPHLLLCAPLQPIPKTRETYTLSYLHYLEQVYPHAVLTADLTRLLWGYEQHHILPPEPEPELVSTPVVDPWEHFVADFLPLLAPQPPPVPPPPRRPPPPPPRRPQPVSVEEGLWATFLAELEQLPSFRNTE
jgi:hypothetical protein